MKPPPVGYDLEEARWVDQLMPQFGRFSTGQSKWIPLGAGNLAPDANLGAYLDRLLLGQPHLWQNRPWDPEGLLSTLPAIVTGLLGIFAGLFVRHPGFSDQKKALGLVVAGLGCVLLGMLWGMEFPVIKKIWTSSYVLVGGGWSAVLFTVFYWVVEVKRWRGWGQPFVWIGMNPITLYLLSNFMGGGGYVRLGTRLAGGSIKEA